MNTPQSRNEITLDWIKHVLKDSAYENPLAIEFDDNFNNQGILAEIVRIKLAYSNNIHKSIIVKFQKCTNKTREGNIYHLLRGKGIKAIPEIIHICSDGTITMEDLSDCSVASIADGCSIEQAKTVLAAIADVHNKFINTNDLPVFDYRKFSGIIDYNMQQSWKQYANQYSGQLGPLENEFKWIWQNPEIVSKSYANGKRVLTHGDLHLENMLFRKSDNHVILIDWQLSDVKAAAFDVSYFLIQNMTVEQRKKQEKLLLEYYYSLVSVDRKECYSFNDFLLEYRACITRSMFSSVMYNGDRFKHRTDYREFSDEITERVISAVKEWKPIEAVKELAAIDT